MKKTIDIICIFSIISTLLCIVLLFANGFTHHGIIVFSEFFGFMPWPMEWVIINIPILILGSTWLIFRYGLLFKQKFPFLFGKVAYGLLVLAFLVVVFLQLIYKR